LRAFGAKKLALVQVPPPTPRRQKASVSVRGKEKITILLRRDMGKYSIFKVETEYIIGTEDLFLIDQLKSTPTYFEYTCTPTSPPPSNSVQNPNCKSLAKSPVSNKKVFIPKTLEKHVKLHGLPLPVKKYLA